MTRSRTGSAILTAALFAAACSPTSPSPTPSVAPTSGPSPAATGSPEPAMSAQPSPTPAPPAAVALSPFVNSSSPGRLVLTTTMSSAGTGVGGAALTATITALDSTYQVLELKGVVPGPADTVTVAFRFNQEGAGPAPIDLKVYRATYSDGGRARNKIANAGFDSGLYRWDPYGTGRVTTPRSDRGDGRMLRLRAKVGQDIAINSFYVTVVPTSTFRLVVTAEVPPAGTLTGYVAAIFIHGTEIDRQIMPLVAPAIPSLSLNADSAGAVVIDQGLPPGRYLVRIEFSGDATHEPASLDQEVVVP